MTTYVVRQGRLVEKYSADDFDPMAVAPARGDFPTPRLSKMEPYRSPIDGHEVTSWAERAKEMRDNDCFDRRDIADPETFYKKGRKAQLAAAKEESDAAGSGFQWTDPGAGSAAKPARNRRGRLGGT